MEKILFLTHTESDGALPKLAREALSAAIMLAQELDGATFCVGLIGAEVAPAAGTMAGCGAAEFLQVTGPEFSASRYASDAAAAEAMARAAEATVILAPATARLSRTLPGVAQRLGGRIDTRVAGIETAGGLKVHRWFYRQRMRAVMSRTPRPWILTVDGGVFAPWTGEAGSVSPREIPVELPAAARRTTVAGERAASTDAQTIRPDADLLFVAGAGWTKKQADGKPHVKEGEELIRVFLDRTQASLGSSKSLVDQSSEGQEVISFMSHLNQVGQTGSTPRHPKGLSTCCHGEEPHVVGWRFIKERRAVNLDPGCGWARGKADVLYVADAFAVLAKVNELLAEG